MFCGPQKTETDLVIQDLFQLLYSVDVDSSLKISDNVCIIFMNILLNVLCTLNIVLYVFFCVKYETQTSVCHTYRLNHQLQLLWK